MVYPPFSYPGSLERAYYQILSLPTFIIVIPSALFRPITPHTFPKRKPIAARPPLVACCPRASKSALHPSLEASLSRICHPPPLCPERSLQLIVPSSHPLAFGNQNFACLLVRTAYGVCRRVLLTSSQSYTLGAGGHRLPSQYLYYITRSLSFQERTLPRVCFRAAGPLP
jgi:hypothetical protein